MISSIPLSPRQNNRLRLFSSLRLLPVSFLVLSVLAGLAYMEFWRRPAPLDQTLAAQFPGLAEGLASRSAEFTPALRKVGGRDVAGLTVSRSSQVTAAAHLDTPKAMPAGLKPVEQEAMRLMAERNGSGELNTFFPQQFTAPFVIEGGGISVELRPLGAVAAAAVVENGKVVYRDAYRETDSLHAVSAGRSEEFLYLRSANAPRRFEYELSDINGARDVSVEGGAVRFKNDVGRGLQIEAPWVVEASGKRREDVVRWELGEAAENGKRRLSLVMEAGAELSYPLVIDPSWSTTGNLHRARLRHTATLLANGKVLVAGGSSSGSDRSAELYDPATGTWSTTGSLVRGRREHTATLLPNGRVLVAGGWTDGVQIFNNPSLSAEVYDPATGTWNTTGSLNTRRYLHTATLLANGKVLIVGGLNAVNGISTTAELFDPAAGTWSPTGSLVTARYAHTATLLANGKVLVAGGWTDAPLSSAELYDPATGTWSPTGSLVSFHVSHTATPLPNGKVLVVAGGVSGGSAELYDPATGTWSPTGSLITRRDDHSAILLPNGKVLVAGGDNSFSCCLASAELYDPATGTWAATGSLAMARTRHTATLLANGRVLVAGGGGNSGAVSPAEVYDPAVGTWAATASLAAARVYHTATLLANGNVLVAGGTIGLNAPASADLYDPATGTWAATASLVTARGKHTATLLANGKVLVAGGIGVGVSYLASAELYDPATGMWTATGSLTTPRFNHTATLLANGKVLVAGGSSGVGYLTSAELYDPANGTWSTTGSLATRRFAHTATVLANGKLLVAGGFNDDYLTSAELYDPAAGTWSPTGSLVTAHYAHTATLLPNGKVLVAGGANNVSYLTSAEVYDPVTGTWNTTGSLATARNFHTATLLTNGKVLVAGGQNSVSFLDSAELYDPMTGTWVVTGSLTTPRFSHTATLLANGKVLVAAGLKNISGGDLASAEVYDIGLGFAASSQPLISSATSPLLLTTRLVLSGSRFQGLSGASSGNNQDSSTNYPLVQLRSLANEQTRFLYSDPAANWSDTSFTSEVVSNFPSGYALVTVFTNGIPSDSELVLITLLDQSITVNTPAPSSSTYNTSFTVAATSTSSLPVSYSSSGGCTNIGPVFTMTSSTSTCTVKYDQAGGGNYNSAPQVTEPVTAQKANQTITFGALADKTFGDADFNVSASATSGLAVRFAASGQCTVTGNTVHLTGLGSCTITATQSGNANYNAAADVQQSFNIAKANQTITFGTLADKAFGDPDFGVSASATSGLTVSFAASGQCTVTGNTVHLTGGGSCTITASQAGDANYNAAADVQQSFNIAKANQTITFGALADKTFGDADFGVSASATSGLAVSFAASGQCSVTGYTVHLSGAGSCTVTASQAGDANYTAAADVQQSFNIAKADQTITFGTLGDKTFGDADFKVSATASSGLGVSFAASGQCTVTGTVHLIGGGVCTITASQAGDSNYNPAADVPQSFNIAKANQTITFGDLADKTFGDADFTVSATASSELSVSFAASGNCAVIVDTVHLTGGGSCTITASQGGDSNYNAATDGSQSFNIGKANQTITFGALANKTFGDADFAVSATASSGLGVSFAASGQCTVTGNTVHLSGGGSCTITASQAGDSNYNAAADVHQSFNVAKANQTITFSALADKTFGDADFTVSATASSLLSVSFAASGQCTVTGNTVHLSGGGVCTITASQAGDSNYNPATDVPQSFNIGKANQTITFGGLAGKTFGDADFTVSATASSLLAVSFAANGQCTVTGNTVNLSGGGACTITASQAGDSNYNAAVDVQQSFNIAKANQTITFGGLAGKTFGDADFTVSATASSLLAVSFAASGQCTVTGNTVHINGGGACTITASQAGDSNYNAAVDVQQSFNIAKANQTITFDVLAAKTFGDADFTVSATASSGLSVSFAASGQCTVTGNTVHITGGGACTITASQAGDANFNVAVDVPQAFNIAKANQTITFGALVGKTFGDADFTVSASASSLLDVSFAASGQCTVTGNTVHITGGGACTITASHAGDTNYNAAVDVQQSFNIAKANQTITFGALVGKTFGDADFTISATASSLLSVSFAASGQCTVTGNTVHINGGGACTITASQAGDSNYNAAADVPQSFNIAKANQTITFGVLAGKTFGDADFTVSATASSLLGVSFTGSGQCLVTGNAVHINAAGACTITAFQAGDTNYNAAPDVQQSFNIAKANQTITIGTHAPATATYNTGFTVAATSNSGLAVAYSSSGICANVGATFTMNNGTGTCTVQYDQAGDSNYNAAAVTELVTAQKADQTITFAPLPDKTELDADFTVSATASSNLGVSFAASGQCTVIGSTVHLTSAGAGSCTITASQGGNSNYNLAPNVARTFSITEVNEAPTSVNDLLSSVAEDSSRTIPFTELTANDSKGPAGENGQTLIVKTVSNPVGGTVSINGGNVLFTPTTNYNGPASFDYTVEDNGTTNSVADPKTSGIAQASFTISEVNDLPNAFDDALSSVVEDSPVRMIPLSGLMTNDSKGPADESGQTLIVKSVSNAVGGTVSIVGGNVLFTPTADFNGAASFKYTIEDDGQTGGVADPKSDIGTVSFTITEVNDAPVTVNDTLGNIPEDAAPRAIPFADLTGNDSRGAANESGQTLTVVTAGSAVGGTVILVPGFVVFTPNDNYNGPASLNYTVQDNGTTNGLSDPKTSAPGVVQFNITEVNDAPTAVNDTLANVATNSAERSIAFTELTANDLSGPADESGQTLTVYTVSNPIGVTVSIVAGTVRITPLADYHGPASFQYTVRDNGTTNGFGDDKASAAATVSFNINADTPSPATPSVTNATTNANTQTTSGLVISCNPMAGGEVTHFKIMSITGGLLFKNDGLTPIHNGDFISYAEGNAGLKFTPGVTNGSFLVKASTSPSDAGLGVGTATAVITVNPVGGVVRFSSDTYSVAEGVGSRTITVERTGDMSQPITVEYLSSDHSTTPNSIPCHSPGVGFASSRCDFTTAIGILRFAAGETSKTFNVMISDDNYVEGTETLELSLSNPTGGAVFGVPQTAELSITDDATEPATNPIDNAADFVRAQYHDVLGREPDAAGLAFWTDNIEKCNDPARRPAGLSVEQCVDKQRESTAVAFFMSPEFQITGGFVYHLYKGSLTGAPNYDGGSPGSSLGRFPTSLEFMRDVSTVSEGIVVNNQISGAVVEANRNRLVAEFVQRPEFVAKYGALTNTLYVDELFNTTGVTPTALEKEALVDGLTGGTETRASVLRKVVDGTVVISESNVQFTTTYGQAFSTQEYRRMFVFMEYFGYLRRNPDAAGFVFWLGKLNFYGGDPFQAEMVKSFILSPEYRLRFGQ